MSLCITFCDLLDFAKGLTSILGVVDVRDVTAIDSEMAFTPRRDFRLQFVIAQNCDKLLNSGAFSDSQCVNCFPVQHYLVSRQ